MILTTITLVSIATAVIGSGSLVYLLPRTKTLHLLIPSYIWNAIVCLSVYSILIHSQILPDEYILHTTILTFVLTLAHIHCGVLVGIDVAVGVSVGVTVGTVVGVAVGVAVGVGVRVGVAVGIAVGVAVGVAVGIGVGVGRLAKRKIWVNETDSQGTCLPLVSCITRFRTSIKSSVRLKNGSSRSTASKCFV